MKILVFCGHYPPFKGGLETHAAEFNHHITQGKTVSQVTVFTSHIPASALRYEWIEPKVYVVRFPAIEIIPNYPFPAVWHPIFWLQFAKLLRSPVSLVVSRTRFFSTTFLAMLFAKIRGIPWMHIEHGSDYVQLHSKLFSSVAYLYDRIMGLIIFRTSTVTVAISKAVERFVGQFDKRVHPVVYRGINKEAIEQVSPDKAIAKVGGVKIAFAGRLIDGKGVHDFLEALVLVREEAWTAYVVGTGPQEERLTHMITTHSLGNRVHLLGEKTRDDTISILKACDIFVHPSYTEGLPTAVVEAALSQCAIVATDVGGTSEIIGEKEGFLVPPRQPEALANSLKRLLNEPTLRKEMALRAKERVENNFSWSDSIKKYEDIIQMVTSPDVSRVHSHKLPVWLVNGLSLLVYGFALFSSSGWAQTIAGVWLLFFVIPFNLVHVGRLQLKSGLEKIVAATTLLMFSYVPLLFFLIASGFMKLNALNLFYVNSALLFLLTLSSPRTASLSFSLNRLRRYAPLLAAGLLFVAIHSINFFFYKFIPEWDSYVKLVEIEKAISQGVITNFYRGFFTVGIATIATITAIPPYQLFVGLGIAMQLLLLLVLDWLVRAVALRSSRMHILILLSTLAVPVLLMETDTLRPQNMVLAFLPVYILFFVQAVWQKRWEGWFLATLIAVMGMNYHEFFIFAFMVHGSVMFWTLYRTYYYKVKTQKDRAIFALSMLVFILAGLLIVSKVPLISVAIAVFKQMLNRIFMVSHWRWWFLSSYNTDGSDLDVSWRGFIGIAQYYAYYMGPVIGLALVGLAGMFASRRAAKELKKLAMYLLPLLIIFFIFAEVFPRMNFYYLPERFWVLIDVVALLSLPFLFKWVESQTFSRGVRSVITGFFVVSVCIGVFGGVYIAYRKKSLTSVDEYTAARWIKYNTDSSAVFLTQAANDPMIKYFANRTVIVPPKSFFLSDQAGWAGWTDQLVGIYEQIAEKQEQLDVSYSAFKESGYSDAAGFQTKIATIAKEVRELRHQEEIIRQGSSVYILYSQDKLTGLYAQRSWWQSANFFGANLEKFDNLYPVVYDRGGVRIWKLR